MLEEAPSSQIDEEKRQNLGATIVKALREIGYINAGTMGFLMDSSNNLYFMEMNTRIQVEHPVTEMITGVDLVGWQLRIAAGQRLDLEQKDIQLSGHAIECRINAEDPNNNFKPAPGTIERYGNPAQSETNTHLRFDTHVAEGYRIPPYYDSMIGKLIVHGESRAQAIERMSNALEQTTVEGVPTTIELHKNILAHENFKSGNYDCQFLGDNMNDLLTPTQN